MLIFAGVLLVVWSWLGVVVTLLTLPGMWMALLGTVLVKWWQPELISWWAIGIAVGCALAGEIAEFGTSAVGSRRAGGSKAGAGGALVGGLAGSIIGTVVLAMLPIIGTILGAVVGAIIGTLVAERSVAQRPWGESFKSAGGAGVGRAAAVVIKGGIAVVQALILTAAVLIPGF